MNADRGRPRCKSFRTGGVDFCDGYSAVKGGVHVVDVFLAQTVLGQTKAFAEISNLSKAIEPFAPQGVCGFSADWKNVRTGPLFLAICLTPRRDLSNQFHRERLAVGELNSAFAGFVVCQAVGECFHSLRARV